MDEFDIDMLTAAAEEQVSKLRKVVDDIVWMGSVYADAFILYCDLTRND